MSGHEAYDETVPCGNGYVELPGSAAPTELPAHIGRYQVERLLGKGGFGCVYLAYDEQLQRRVAIKVPHPHLVACAEDAEAYLAEARTVANLEQPNIVPVHDVGSTDEFPCYVVSRFVEGVSLAVRMRQARPTPHEAAALVATVAEALHHAHTRGVVHRDVKPGNILLDAEGKPFLVDFGLALREQRYGKELRYAGTPSYMSPEQARGEGHRVDGRSDIFSLGVVFYELLTDRRPFQADSRAELFDQIATQDPRPPRQVHDRVAKELERICLKALSKRVAERYTTARDMADDLRHYLSGVAAPTPNEKASELEARRAGPDTASVPTTWGRVACKIVPKGLRAFDEHDADFFLDLLPGPRDRQGLPESIRFWKSRIEEADAESTFSVGVIYGPSGCGKSSLVRAGLLPHLSRRVAPIYVQATPEGTETRLLHRFRSCCAGPPERPNLAESLAAWRQSAPSRAGGKILLILDQFEQWLHAKWEAEGEHSGLVRALRQCDGGSVQCVIMVRDDFWLATSRFMRALEIRLLEGHNSALVDLFRGEHATQVLAAFGRAFGQLPESPREITPQQRDFLRQAIAGLAEDGKVACVQLALFAETLKGKPWTPPSLKDVGGVAGVGVAFLEETFSAKTASPPRRLHEKAARSVLTALLPESGADIKARMRRYDELLDASGYRNRPGEFEELVGILDAETRLITPTEPDSADTGRDSATLSTRGAKYFQLTHDYLVPSLREWLSRNQRRTRRGRAELRLAERTALWTAKPEPKQLPSWWEWSQVRLFTRKQYWTTPQRRMMSAATRHHAARLAVWLSLLAAAALVGFVVHRVVARKSQLARADDLVSQLWQTDTEHLPDVLNSLEQHRGLWEDAVARVARDAAKSPEQRTRAHLALARNDARSVPYLADRLREADSKEHRLLNRELTPWRTKVVPRLWDEVRRDDLKPDQVLRLAASLAYADPDTEEWRRLSARAVQSLVNKDPLSVLYWVEELRPVRSRLWEPLAAVFHDATAHDSERLLAASIIASYGESDPAFVTTEKLSELVLEADAAQYAGLSALVLQRGPAVAALMEAELKKPVSPRGDAAGEKLTRRKVTAAEALLRLDQNHPASWALLRQDRDPGLRTLLIERVHRAGVPWSAALRRLDQEREPTVRQAIVLGLHAYRGALSDGDRKQVIDRLTDLYQSDPDAGVHAAAEWLLRQWGRAGQVEEMERKLAGKPRGPKNWFVNRQLQTLVVVAVPGVATIGSPEYEVGRDENESLRQVTIDYTFAISSHEVTVAQYRRFRPDFPYVEEVSPEARCPVNKISFDDAVAYCRWLDEQESGALREGRGEQGNATHDQPGAPRGDERRGDQYRLPTDAEWEYAVRAGSQTSRFFGNAVSDLVKYAWCAANADERTWPVGQLMPNPRGMFDTYGNVSEWCYSHGRLTAASEQPARGGNYRSTPRFLRSAMPETSAANRRISVLGFRVVGQLDTR